MLAKRLHPDAGGNEDDFKSMQAAFAAAWARLKNMHVNKAGERYERDTQETAEDFMEIINELIRLRNIRVEICGSWIWCSGDTKPYRSILKKLHFRWSKSKSAWYFHRDPYRKYNSRELTLDEIRTMYGSKMYEEQQNVLRALHED